MSKIADLMLMAAGAGGGAPLDLTFYESRNGADIGSVNVYVVDDSGAIKGSAVYSASGPVGGGWAQRTASTPAVSGTFRISWHYVSGSGFRGDYAVDTVSIQGSAYDITSGDDGWLTSTSDTTSSTTAFSGAAQVAIANTGGLFNKEANSTPSNLTGPTGPQSGSYYIYAETSSAGNPNKNFWLFSPEITV